MSMVEKVRAVDIAFDGTNPCSDEWAPRVRATIASALAEAKKVDERGVEAQKCYETVREKLAEMVACQQQLNEMHDAEVAELRAMYEGPLTENEGTRAAQLYLDAGSDYEKEHGSQIVTLDFAMTHWADAALRQVRRERGAK